MHKSPRALFIATAMALSAVATVHGSTETCTSESAVGGDSCCFANPRFTGVCQVTPAADETCAGILAYLNNQASVGKTYCGNTKVRGGWAQVDCEGSGETSEDAVKP